MIYPSLKLKKQERTEKKNPCPISGCIKSTCFVKASLPPVVLQFPSWKEIHRLDWCPMHKAHRLVRQPTTFSRIILTLLAILFVSMMRSISIVRMCPEIVGSNSDTLKWTHKKTDVTHVWHHQPVIWVNDNNSLTWIEVIWEWFPYENHDFQGSVAVRSGRYNLPR